MVVQYSAKPPRLPPVAMRWPTLRLRDAVAQRHDLARDLVARHEGQRRLVLVLALDAQHGGEAHARRADLDQDLAGGRARAWARPRSSGLSIGP